jgi:hypothetical protein
MGDDEARRILLARRARFVAAALASVAATATGVGAATEGCGGDTDDEQTQAPQVPPQSCLAQPLEDSGERPPDAGEDAPPQPCLKVAPDASEDADAEPQPCLAPRIDGG